jgi:hypothetical protein
MEAGSVAVRVPAEPVRVLAAVQARAVRAALAEVAGLGAQGDQVGEDRVPAAPEVAPVPGVEVLPARGAL